MFSDVNDVVIITASDIVDRSLQQSLAIQHLSDSRVTSETQQTTHFPGGMVMINMCRALKWLTTDCAKPLLPLK